MPRTKENKLFFFMFSLEAWNLNSLNTTISMNILLPLASGKIFFPKILSLFCTNQLLNLLEKSRTDLYYKYHDI